MMWSLAIATAFLLSFMVSCEGTGHVVVTLKSYNNPKRYTESKGKCCDRVLFGICSACDVYFKLCVGDSASSSICNIGKSETGKVDKRNYHQLNIRKDFAFQSFTGNIMLKLEVWDKDRFTPDDLVFKQTKYITLPSVKPGVSSSSHYRSSQELRGRYVTVTLDLEVYCDKHFYGDSCTTKCIRRDDSSGHYTCDNLGRKVCMRGWHGRSCTRHCVPRDDPQHGHFHCDKEGNKLCMRNWQGPTCKSCVRNHYGTRCSAYCMPQDNEDQGHYKCRPSDGKKVCLPWWFGTECRTHCIPHGDDNNGHYACAHDGSKTCKTGWHGENCTVFCVPQDDDVRGHYTCDIHGNKVCLDGYRPPECTDCLLGRYGANCSMTCSNSTQEGYYDCSDVGLMKCKQWWYGPLCQQYCVPHDDNMHGHYECDPRDGSKVCLAGWKGPSCLVTSKN